MRKLAGIVGIVKNIAVYYYVNVWDQKHREDLKNVELLMKNANIKKAGGKKGVGMSEEMKEIIRAAARLLIISDEDDKDHNFCDAVGCDTLVIDCCKECKAYRKTLEVVEQRKEPA